MTRLEWMIRHGKDGVRLGIVDVDWAIKYETYITYLEFFDQLKSSGFIDPPHTGIKGKRTARSEAIALTSDRLNISLSTVWKHLSAFDYISPTTEEKKIIKTQTHWTLS